MRTPKPAESLPKRPRRSRRPVSVRQALWWLYCIGLLTAYGVVLTRATSMPTATGLALAYLRSDGARVAGLGVAAAALLGVRTGARGASLPFSRPDIYHVLMAPIDRKTLVRRTVARKNRTFIAAAITVGSIAGLALGAYVSVSSVLVWCAAGIAYALTLSGTYAGLTALCSSASLPSRAVQIVRAIIVAVTAIDLLSAPLWVSWKIFGQVLLFPLVGVHWSIVLPVATTLAGLVVSSRSLPRIHLEALERRAEVLPLLRFAVMTNDMHNVATLYSRLGAEQPRATPRFIARTRQRWPVWRRSWRSVARWPSPRIWRLVALAAAQTAILRLTWQSPLPWLAITGGLLAFGIALELNGPLLSETASEDRMKSHPRWTPGLIAKLLGVPLLIAVVIQVVCVLAALLGTTSAVGYATGASIAAGTMAAIAATLGAGLAVTSKETLSYRPADLLGPPELAFLRAMVRLFLPQLVALLGYYPVSLLGAIPPMTSIVGATIGIFAVAGLAPLVFLLLREAGALAKLSQRVEALLHGRLYGGALRP